MLDDDLLRRVHSLGDLELAMLVSLTAREHCLISTTPDRVDDLAEELGLIARRIFGLAPAVVTCHAHTTLDDFATALLVRPSPPPPLPSPALTRRSASPYYGVARGAAEHSSAGAASGSYFPPRPGSGGNGSGRRSNAYSPTNPGPSSQYLHHRHYPHHHNQRHNSNNHNHHHQAAPPPGPAQIANVVIAKNLDRAPKIVQIQALELLRTRRIFTRTAVQTAPRQFLLAAVVGAPSGGEAHVTPHLNDFLHIAHWHDPADGFAHLEGYGYGSADGNNNYNQRSNAAVEEDDAASTASSESVIKRGGSSGLGSSFTADEAHFHLGGRNGNGNGNAGESSSRGSEVMAPLFADGEVTRLAQLGQQAYVDVDVQRYQANVAAFLRMHRAVAGGVSPAATKHFEQLAKNLAPLHGLDYVTPALVALAARNVYLHRLRIVTPEKERSMQWGSDLEAVAALLDGVGPEDVIEDVLSMVAVPP